LLKKKWPGSILVTDDPGGRETKSTTPPYGKDETNRGSNIENRSKNGRKGLIGVFIAPKLGGRKSPGRARKERKAHPNWGEKKKFVWEGSGLQ